MTKIQHRISAQRVVLAQSLCAKLKTLSIKLHPNQMMRLGFILKKFNGLPTSKPGCHSDKVSELIHVWSKLNADFTSLVETQINPSLLPNKDSLHATMFLNQRAI